MNIQSVVNSGERAQSVAGLESPSDVSAGLRSVNYLADERISSAVYVAANLGKPILVEGEAGAGKTELAKSVAQVTGRRLVRLQCYEGLDEAKVLYEWNYRMQLLRLQVDRGVSDDDWDSVRNDIFSSEYLLKRPLLDAITATEPVVLLVDEVDRTDVEVEALLLEVLGERQVTIPELGTMRAATVPLVFLTSNASRKLSEALRRRCAYLWLDYPSVERESQIIQMKVPELDAAIRHQLTLTIQSLRSLDLQKPPSVAESLDWARTLVLLGADTLDEAVVRETLHTVIKIHSDLEIVESMLLGDGAPTDVLSTSSASRVTS